MTRKLSWLAVVSLAAGLLFTACPIQFDPDVEAGGDPIDVDPNLTGTGISTVDGYVGDFTLTVVFYNGQITGITVDHMETNTSPIYAGNRVNWAIDAVIHTQSFDWIDPPDHFSGATVTGYVFLYALQNAIRNVQPTSGP